MSSSAGWDTTELGDIIQPNRTSMIPSQNASDLPKPFSSRREMDSRTLPITIAEAVTDRNQSETPLKSIDIPLYR